MSLSYLIHTHTHKKVGNDVCKHCHRCPSTCWRIIMFIAPSIHAQIFRLLTLWIKNLIYFRRPSARSSRWTGWTGANESLHFSGCGASFPTELPVLKTEVRVYLQALRSCSPDERLGRKLQSKGWNQVFYYRTSPTETNKQKTPFFFVVSPDVWQPGTILTQHIRHLVPVSRSLVNHLAETTRSHADILNLGSPFLAKLGLCYEPKWRRTKTLINSRLPNLRPFCLAKLGFGAKTARSNFFHALPARLSGSVVKKARPGPHCHISVCVHRLAEMIRCRVDLTLTDGMGLLVFVSNSRCKSKGNGVKPHFKSNGNPLSQKQFSPHL